MSDDVRTADGQAGGSGAPGEGEESGLDVAAIAKRIKGSAARIAGYLAASGKRRGEAAGNIYPPTRRGFLNAIAGLEEDVAEERALIVELKEIEPWLP